MKIAIGTCERTNGKCSTMGCFRAYNNKEKHFAQYEETNIELLSFFTCDICSEDSKENIMKIAERFKKEGVERIHLGACAVKCKADNLEEIKEIFTSMNIGIYEGTH